MALTADPGGDEDVLRSDLADLSDLDLAEVMRLPETALVHALRRLLSGLDGSGDTYFLGHNSSLPGA
ncbi:hypothetical protein Sme01_56930 [Sphaerisporangium melleum]|uniref:FXSXX-COOH protein n=1 Tax=Sphaerisporangium melleum TaxID=321316 RepID=A0A917VKI3_9ACTN|nr:FxSxx-COOH cyclophane-containing RiPP peptide [Sphaerisporangium melleum]GGK94206.1 hypothetical protein GCM10007964_40810 [Sphaerisporangium melleum]GII73217.1 hypothetical protein Sme01_56930 [Sphaerisporangium melleum]